MIRGKVRIFGSSPMWPWQIVHSVAVKGLIMHRLLAKFELPSRASNKTHLKH